MDLPSEGDWKRDVGREPWRDKGSFWPLAMGSGDKPALARVALVARPRSGVTDRSRSSARFSNRAACVHATRPKPRSVPLATDRPARSSTRRRYEHGCFRETLASPDVEPLLLRVAVNPRAGVLQLTMRGDWAERTRTDASATDCAAQWSERGKDAAARVPPDATPYISG